jgi:hypothetical protein
LTHHYYDFFMTYDRPLKKEKEQISGSVEQKTEKKEENKETKCSDTEK